jgi:glycolate oxidase FAD binding subunit
MHAGNVPGRYDIALSLWQLDQVTEHEPADLTLTCQAGITLDRLQSHLARHGQIAPFGPPWSEDATVGGILAANASGPSRHAYGAPRDFTIGLRVVTADGRFTKAGGRVVKNVAGYDLCKLYIGSLGTLGIIVEATFKLAPLPQAERTLIVSFNTSVDACSFAGELQRRGLALRAAQILNHAAASATGLATEGRIGLVLDLAGTPQAVDRSQRETSELARAETATVIDSHDPQKVWESIRTLVSPTDAVLSCKAAALPTRLPALIDAVEAIERPPHILALPTVGVLHASWADLHDADAAVGRLRSAVSTIDGSLVLERCPLDLKHRLDVFGEPPPSFDLMRRVKEQFDPKGVLSPGRHVGRL